jgi:TolB-like protein
VLVTAFEEEGDQSSFPTFTRGFTRSLIIALTRFTGLCVFGAETALRHPADTDAAAAGRELAADYLVTGQTSLQPGGFEVDVLLLETKSGRAVWAESFERRLRPSEIIALRNEVANRVARALAQPYGAIQSDRARDADAHAPEALGSYAAVLLFYAYWRTFDRDMIEKVRIGLEHAVAAEPDYAEALACLSLVYCNALRYRHPIDAPEADPGERAMELAGRAVELAPNSSWARYALGLARWFSGDAPGGLDALEAGRGLNPNDTTILADLGQRYAMLARWDEAVPLLEESYATNPAQPGGYRVGLCLYHLAHGRFEAALGEARRINAPSVIYGHLTTAVAAAELGLVDEAACAVAAIRGLDPGYGARVAADLESRHVAPELIVKLIAGLRKAGLDVPGKGSVA